MAEKVLVTGGAGYLGSILVEDLLSLGYHVEVVDNFRYQQNSLAHLCSNERFSIVRGDVRDERLMIELATRADIIIPLAALVGAPLCNWDTNGATSTNRDACITLFKKLSPSQWVLMPTTNSSYGAGQGTRACTEESPLNPLSLYARDKVEVEVALMQRENSMSFRLATVFGMAPRMRLDLLVNDFTYRAVYDRFVVLFEAHFKRNYIHVRDVSRVFKHGLKQFGAMKGQIYNVGLSDANLSKKELCEIIQKQVSEFTFFEASVGKDPDKRDYIVSSAKIEKTGFTPKFSLSAGIAELVKGFQMIKRQEYSNI